MKPQTKSHGSTRLQSLKNTCVDFMKAYQDRKVGEMISLCSRDATIWFKPLGGDGQGTVHELGKNLWTTLIDCFPDINNTVHSISSEGDQIRCIVSIRGTQVKDFAGIRNKNLSFDSEHIFVFKINDDKQIGHIDITWDHSDFIKQLGG